MKRSLIILLLVLCLVLTLSGSVLADDDNYSEVIIEDIIIDTNEAGIIPFRYSLINSITASLSIRDNIAYCTGRVVTTNTVAKIEIDMYLQKFSGGEWTTIWAQWSSYKNNTDDFLFQRQAPITNGSYRLYVVGTVTPYGNDDGETQSIISETAP